MSIKKIQCLFYILYHLYISVLPEDGDIFKLNKKVLDNITFG